MKRNKRKSKCYQPFSFSDLIPECLPGMFGSVVGQSSSLPLSAQEPINHDDYLLFLTASNTNVANRALWPQRSQRGRLRGFCPHADEVHSQVLFSQVYEQAPAIGGEYLSRPQGSFPDCIVQGSAGDPFLADRCPYMFRSWRFLLLNQVPGLRRPRELVISTGRNRRWARGLTASFYADWIRSTSEIVNLTP